VSVLREHPDVRNIPAGHCFADALAQGILERTASDPLALSTYTIFLPNRRSARTLREAFLRLSGGRAVLLPRMQPLGDVDADEVSLLLAEKGAMPDIPPAISPLERQLLLAQTIIKAGVAQSFDQAVALALELGRFLDEVQTEHLDFSGLQNLVPEAFAEHWQKTLEFLKILTEHWPGILQERGVIDPAARRNLLLAAQVDVWRLHPPQNPVIAAGSTGTVPAACDLLALISRLPQGMVVLPGLDTIMDPESWDVIREEHPQYNIKMLLARLGIERTSVTEWALGKKQAVNTARVRLISEAMRPAETTEKWRALTVQDIPGHALEGLTRIDCDTPQEEAGVIALLLREALETKGKTAALITPDRRLARRVALALRRWGIHIDDSGGQPLTELSAGAWLMLTAEMAEEALSPVTLLSVLKHPIMAAGMRLEELHGMVYLLDRLVLRGPRPSPGFKGLRMAIGALEDRHLPSAKKLLDWLERVESLMAPFVTLMSEGKEIPFRALLSEHIRMAEALAATLGATGGERLWRNEAGEMASDLLGELLAASSDVPPLIPTHYASLLRAFLKASTVRPRYGTHPRLSILGQVEARLYCADMVILGSLNEDAWPALPQHDPWMSRPMRKQFGLPSPERILGIAAHDFVQAATAPEVFLTRARKVEGTPTVPARWLLRIETVLKAMDLVWSDTAALRYRQWVRDMDAPAAVKSTERPAPRPPVTSRPRALSVTQIEAWVRDPYQIYARKILGLKKLDPIDADPGGAERGTFIHAALEQFINVFPATLPDDAVDFLIDFGRQALLQMRVPQEVEAFWWPRFEKIARIFVQQEREWRLEAKPFLTEVQGLWTFQTPGGPFSLSGKADRIDRFLDGAYAIIDYKSGFTPQNTEVRQGLSPQLPLEALMLEKGAFEKISGGKTRELVYWRVTGSGQKPVERKSVTPRDCSVEQMTADAEEGLRRLVDVFDDESTPYLSQPRADAKPRFSDYDHLARVREWSVAGEGEE
jgi:ATP-dependent helicase/nuclease subunit B